MLLIFQSVYRIGKVSDEELLTWLNFQEVHDYVCGIHDGKVFIRPSIYTSLRLHLCISLCSLQSPICDL